MARTLDELNPEEIGFLTERHLGTLSTVGPGGRPHVTAIAFTLSSDGLVRIITSIGSQKVKNIERSPFAAVCQVEGRRWLTLEGPAKLVSSAEGIALAVEAFEARYRPTRPNPQRVAIEITVERILGRA